METRNLLLLGAVLVLFALLMFNFNSSQTSVEAKGTVTLYYATWCGHCKNFMPAYDAFTEEAKAKYPGLVVNKVNCVTSECPNIPGYPTVKYVSSSGNTHDFRGPRTVEGLHAFVSSSK
jgi:thiol-disulfide isomerase/thioredoxin